MACSAARAPPAKPTSRDVGTVNSRGVQPYQAAAVAVKHMLAEMPHRGDGGAGTHLDHHGALHAQQPMVLQARLGGLALVQPVPVIEHHDVGAGHATAVRAAGRRIAQQALLLVHVRLEIICGPDGRSAALEALQVVDGAMAFVDGRWIEPGFLELPVHVAGEDAAAVVHAGPPAAQDLEARMRLRRAVQLQAMAVEAPGPRRMVVEGVRAGDAGEVDPLPGQCRVGVPEPGGAPEVRQARIHAHACARCNDQRIGLQQQLGGVAQGIRVQGKGRAGVAVHAGHGNRSRRRCPFSRTPAPAARGRP